MTAPVHRMAGLFAGTAMALAMFDAGPAEAQSGRQEVQPAPEQMTADAGDDIIVTARRREERLQTTPVSATVLSGEALSDQNIRDFQDIRGAASNLELTPLGNGGTSFTVRGIGQVNDQVNNDTKTGLYLDGMYVARLEGNDLSFYDISSVQVLRGPQGTLFGKNTTAGAVLVTTNRPEQEYGGYLQVRAGSYDRLETEGAVNLPIADGLSSRISFRSREADGFIRHVVNDGRSNNVNDRSLRGQLRYEGQRLVVDFLAEHDVSETDGGSDITLGCDPAAFYISNYNSLHSVPYCTAYPVLGEDYLVYGGATLSIPTSTAITDIAVGGDANADFARQVGQSPFNDTTVDTFNARASYDITSDIAFTSATTYRRSRAARYRPTNDAPDDIYAEADTTRTRQYTQEFTLGGRAFDSRLDWMTGLYYFNQETSLRQDTGPDWVDPLGYVYDGQVKYRSYAAFAQASFHVTPKLELTAGLRYTHDYKSGDSYVFFAGNGASYVIDGQTYQCGYFVGDFLGGITNCAGDPFTASDNKTWSSTDPMVQIGYEWSDSVYTYISASHGYNAGGFNQQISSQSPDGKFLASYDPEKLWSYEIGLKTSLFDRRAMVNIAAFYQDYSDIQSQVLLVINDIPTRQLQTAATAHQSGVEVEFMVNPIADLVLRGNYAYLEQGYDSVRPGAVITVNTPIGSAPDYTFSLAASYTFHLANNGVLTPTIDVRGVGSKPACQLSDPVRFACELPAYELVGFRLEYMPSEDSEWRIAAYGSNVFDEKVFLARTGFAFGQGIDRYTPGRPAEFGVELRMGF